MDKENDNRFIEFNSFSWWCDDDSILYNNRFNLSYYTKEKIENANFPNDSIVEGHIIEISNKSLNCSKFINMETDYFEKIYDEIYRINFEKLAKASFDGCDGGQFEVRIGIKNGFNEYFKKLGLWSPPCVKSKGLQLKIELILKYYEEIIEISEFKKWQNDILKDEYTIYKKNRKRKRK